jgi:hypothetical protein
MAPNAALFVAFGLVATVCDQVWVRLGVLVYPRPFLFGQAWWVPLLFGAVGVVFVYLAVYLTRILLPASTPPARDPGGRALLSAAWFVAAYLAGGLFDAQATTLAVLLLILWLARLAESSRSLRELLVIAGLGIAIAAGGSLGEAVFSWLGLMRYPRPDFLGLPLWLPALWLHAALLARDLGRAWYGGR